MIILKDSIEINTKIDKVYDWFMNLDKNFTRWHPNHKEFKRITGGDNIWDIVFFEECVNWICYKIKAKIIVKEKTKNSFKIVIKSTIWLAIISFSAKTTKNGCVFTYIEEFGMKDNLIGNIINFLIFNVLASKQANWDIIMKDMKEDNINLKNIMENKKI